MLLTLLDLACQGGRATIFVVSVPFGFLSGLARGETIDLGEGMWPCGIGCTTMCRRHTFLLLSSFFVCPSPPRHLPHAFLLVLLSLLSAAAALSFFGSPALPPASRRTMKDDEHTLPCRYRMVSPSERGFAWVGLDRSTGEASFPSYCKIRTTCRSSQGLESPGLVIRPLPAFPRHLVVRHSDLIMARWLGEREQRISQTKDGSRKAGNRGQTRS
jgi:hypothetical protein